MGGCREPLLTEDPIINTPTRIFGEHDAKTLAQLEDVARDAERVALMADGHLGYIMPIGGVAAYQDQVSVPGVGYDIACGNAAIATDMHITDLGLEEADPFVNPYRIKTNTTLNKLADDIAGAISFGVGRTNEEDDAPTDHPLFLDPAWYLIPNEGRYRDDLRDKARRQLGTVGGGNHYVDVFMDDDGFLWVGVHFGSRGLGHTIATNFLAIGQGGTWGDRMKEAQVLLDIREQHGSEYWALMNLAGEYAYAGREWVARKVVSILGAQETALVHNHHNFAWKETHSGREVVVVRKGATPAFPGQLGFVGGSMGDMSVILQGATYGSSVPGVLTDQVQAMYSTVHGAGRIMGRNQAKGKWKKGKCVRPGAIDHGMMKEATRGVVVRGGDLDEAPQVYRQLGDVLEAQGHTVEVLRNLTPLIVCMAPPRTVDPYKD